MKITLVEYSLDWPRAFEKECRLLLQIMGDSATKIEHVGSTSVSGMVSKPIIDIMVGLDDFNVADDLVPKVVELGYKYYPEYEDVMPYRRFFKRFNGDTVTHHIHMTEIRNEFWQRHLLFRDYLRSNSETAEEYASLKKELAKRDWLCSNDFSQAKTEFIRSVEDRAAKISP